MAATVHVGSKKNIKYTNNTGTNVRIIIYYLKVTHITDSTPFYMTYGDANQMVTNGIPSELSYDNGTALGDTEYGPAEIGEGYSSGGEGIIDRGTTATSGSGTGLKINGTVTDGDQLYVNFPDTPSISEGGSGYAIGDTFTIDGGTEEPTFKVSETFGGNESVKIKYAGSAGSSETIEIGANLAVSQLTKKGDGGEGAGSALALQNARPYYDNTYVAQGEDYDFGYAIPTELFLSNGHAFELHCVGIASTHIEAYNFVAIPEGG